MSDEHIRRLERKAAAGSAGRPGPGRQLDHQLAIVEAHILCQRDFAASFSTPRQYFDDLTFTGTAVP